MVLTPTQGVQSLLNRIPTTKPQSFWDVYSPEKVLQNQIRQQQIEANNLRIEQAKEEQLEKQREAIRQQEFQQDMIDLYETRKEAIENSNSEDLDRVSYQNMLTQASAYAQNGFGEKANKILDMATEFRFRNQQQEEKEKLTQISQGLRAIQLGEQGTDFFNTNNPDGMSAVPKPQKQKTQAQPKTNAYTIVTPQGVTIQDLTESQVLGLRNKGTPVLSEKDFNSDFERRNKMRSRREGALTPIESRQQYLLELQNKQKIQNNQAGSDTLEQTKTPASRNVVVIRPRNQSGIGTVE